MKSVIYDIINSFSSSEDETKEIVPVGGAAKSEIAENSHCGGEWKTPRNCDPANLTCEYSAKWEYLPRSDEIKFTITTSHTEKWTGIGFSDNERMVSEDFLESFIFQVLRLKIGLKTTIYTL